MAASCPDAWPCCTFLCSGQLLAQSFLQQGQVTWVPMLAPMSLPTMNAQTPPMSPPISCDGSKPIPGYPTEMGVGQAFPDTSLRCVLGIAQRSCFAGLLLSDNQTPSQVAMEATATLSEKSTNSTAGGLTKSASRRLRRKRPAAARGEKAEEAEDAQDPEVKVEDDETWRARELVDSLLSDLSSESVAPGLRQLAFHSKAGSRAVQRAFGYEGPA